MKLQFSICLPRSSKIKQVGIYIEFFHASSNMILLFYVNKGCSWSDRDNFVKMKDFYDVLKIDHARAAGPPAVWEYYVDDFVNGMATGWYPYDDAGRDNCEDLWNTYLANKSYSMRIVESGNMGFQYLVNLTKMTQMNVKTMKERHIRRIDADL
jgi:hypothetical protein